MSKTLEPIPAKTKEFKEWEEAGKPIFQHFSSREELEAYFKYVEENEKILPF